MELRDVIENRRTVRDFKSKPVSRAIIEFAIQNGFKAPTYNHLREWNFLVINSLESKLKLIESEYLDEPLDIKMLESVFQNEETEVKDMYLDAIPKQKRMILEAPSVIVVVYKPKTPVEDAKKIYDLNCLASVWTCIQNFMLSLAEHDIFGVTFVPQHTNNIREKLGIPGELEVASIIPIGYKADNARILKQKKIDISQRIHFEKW